MVVGVGNIGGPYKTKTKPVYKYECSGKDAEIAFDIIKPFLSIIKLSQGERARQDYYKFKKP